MSVSTTSNRIVYTGNNSTVTAYPVPFRVLATDHIQVSQRTNLEPNAEWNQLAGSFDVTLIDETGMAEVKTHAAWDDENEILIMRVVPTTQPAEYPVSGPFPAKSHEKALDRGTMIDQQLEADIRNCLKLRTKPEELDNTVFPQPYAGVLGYDAEQNPIIYDFATLAESIEGLYTMGPFDGASLASRLDVVEDDLAAAEVLTATIRPSAAMCSARMFYVASPDNRIIPNNAVTTVKLNTSPFDTGGMYDATNGKINILKGGYYRVNVRAAIEAGSAATRFVAQVHKTSGGVSQGWLMAAERATHASEYAILGENEIFYLNYGDVLRLEIYQNSGADAVLKLPTLATDVTAFQVGLTVEEINPEIVIPVVPLMSRRVVMYGDSQTEGNICGTANVAGEWLTSSFVNRGTAGITLATIVSTKLSNIAADATSQTDFILAAGVNDLGYSATPVIATIAGYIATIMATASPLYRSITWVVPGGVNYPTYTGNSTINANISLLVAAVQALNITGLNIVRVDTNTTLGVGSNPLNLIWRNDGLHYTRKAQKALADLIYPTL